MFTTQKEGKPHLELRAELRDTINRYSSCLLVKYASVRLYKHARFVSWVRCTRLREPVTQLWPEVPGYVLINLPNGRPMKGGEGYGDARCEQETKETANGMKPKGRMCVRAHIEASKFPGHELAISSSLKELSDCACARRWTVLKGQSGN